MCLKFLLIIRRMLYALFFPNMFVNTKFGVNNLE